MKIYIRKTKKLSANGRFSQIIKFEGLFKGEKLTNVLILSKRNYKEN